VADSEFGPDRKIERSPWQNRRRIDSYQLGRQQNSASVESRKLGWFKADHSVIASLASASAGNATGQAPLRACCFSSHVVARAIGAAKLRGVLKLRHRVTPHHR